MPFQLPTQEQKHDYCLEQFERIARGYDLSNDVISLGMHRAWKLRAVQELIGTCQSGKFLDVCCGTGDLALKIAKRLKPGSSVTGVDFAQNMLDLAKVREQKMARRYQRLEDRSDIQNIDSTPKVQKVRQARNVQLDWVRGDAQNLPFAANTFDGAIISFGLRNLTDLQKGIDEITRVVKPGGYVINLDLGHCEMPLFAPVFSFYFSRVVPVIGGILQIMTKLLPLHLFASVAHHLSQARGHQCHLPTGRAQGRDTHLPGFWHSGHASRLKVMSSRSLDDSSAPSEPAAGSSSGAPAGADAPAKERSLMIIVGDHSAERYTAKIIERLNILDPQLKIWGVGGPIMQAQGMELLYNHADFAVIVVL